MASSLWLGRYPRLNRRGGSKYLIDVSVAYVVLGLHKVISYWAIRTVLLGAPVVQEAVAVRCSSSKGESGRYDRSPRLGNGLPVMLYLCIHRSHTFS